MRIFILSLFSFLFSLVSFSQETEDSILNALRTDDISKLKNYMTRDLINKEIGNDSIVPLAYAAFYKSNNIGSWLIKNRADVNKYSGGRTPLMWAAIAANPGMIKLLITSKASINLTDDSGNTALIYASAGGCLECVELLINSGAVISIKNQSGLDAEFYASQSQYIEIENVLRRSRINFIYPDKGFREGPHIKWLNGEKAEMIYFVSRAGKSKVKTIKKIYKIPGDSAWLKGLGQDKRQYFIRRDYKPEAEIYSDIDSILIIGDIHGDLLKVGGILMNSGVINNDLSWNWGKGHVIFIGDIFDRGDNVTEILWLIKSLQHQALKTGGGVHLLLGNHELMNLIGDNRYISDKYFYLNSKISIGYSDLYTEAWDMGRWLRSLNTVLKINDILILHAGISPELLEKKLSITKLNEEFRSYLSGEIQAETDSLGLFLTGPDGPLWYRGLVYPDPSGSNKELNTFNEALEFYNASRMIVGHTPDNSFRLKFNNRFICIDVSTSKDDDTEQALLIREGEYFKVFKDGSIKNLFKD